MPGSSGQDVVLQGPNGPITLQAQTPQMAPTSQPLQGYADKPWSGTDTAKPLAGEAKYNKATEDLKKEPNKDQKKDDPNSECSGGEKKREPFKLGIEKKVKLPNDKPPQPKLQSLTGKLGQAGTQLARHVRGGPAGTGVSQGRPSTPAFKAGTPKLDTPKPHPSTKPLTATVKHEELPTPKLPAEAETTPLKPQQPKFDIYKTGPHYPGTKKLDSFAGWDDLLKEGRKTPSEKDVINAMSTVEGNMDAINAYDSAIVSIGSMQKIAQGAGTGELPNQLWEFSQSNPADYKRLFADQGWTAEKVTVPIKDKKTGQQKVIKGKPQFQTTGPYLYYEDPVSGKKMTGETLRTFLRQWIPLTAEEKAQAKAKRMTPKQIRAWEREKTRAFADRVLRPLANAGLDPAYQRKQVIDFNSRLKSAINTVPKGYSHKIGEYLTSQLAAALVLDQSVNRPGHVKPDMGAALDAFYKSHPKADKDPSKWSAQERAVYEDAILKLYAGDPSAKGDAGLRSSRHKKGGMTNPTGRRDLIRNYKLRTDPVTKQPVHLSDAPGSLQMPPEPPPKSAAKKK